VKHRLFCLAAAAPSHSSIRSSASCRRRFSQGWRPGGVRPSRTRRQPDRAAVRVLLLRRRLLVPVPTEQLHLAGARDTPVGGHASDRPRGALGSHANYFSAGEHPIRVDGVPPQALAILRALGLPPPSDFAFAGETAGPPAGDGRRTPIHRIDEDHPTWTSFPGFWGELQYFHGPGPIGTVGFGTSPKGPAYHAVWTDPHGELATWAQG
jgi:hypothetical protein